MKIPKVITLPPWEDQIHGGSKVYTSKWREVQNNTFYPNCVEVNDLDHILQAAQYDHMTSEMKGGYRSAQNFVKTEMLMFDLDNTHTEHPEEWKTIADIKAAFPETFFFYVQSRNYMKTKVKNGPGGKVFLNPREKYHIYFPLLCPITDPATYSRVVAEIVGLFPYFDTSAIDTARFFFGVEDPKGGEVRGNYYIDTLLNNIQSSDLEKEIEVTLQAYKESIENKVYAEAQGRQTLKKVQEALAQVGARYLESAGGRPSDPADPRKMIAQPYRSDGTSSALGSGSEADFSWMKVKDQEKAVQWFLAWADHYKVPVGRSYLLGPTEERYKNAVLFCVRCAWDNEHSMTGADNETVVVVQEDGKLAYLCRHTHTYSWKEYRAEMERRYIEQYGPDPEDEDGQRIEDGWTQHKALQGSQGAQEARRTPGEDNIPSNPAERQKAGIQEAEAEKERQKAEAYKSHSCAGYLQEFIDGVAESVSTPPISTGFDLFDLALDGGLYADLHTMGAISSIGKTTFVLQMADQIAAGGHDVLFIAMEMARAELIAKSISRQTMNIVLKTGGKIGDAKTVRGIMDGTRYSHYSRTERDLINAAVMEYSKYAGNLYIRQGIGNITAGNIRKMVETHKKYTGRTPVIIVDYLQILKPMGKFMTDKQAVDESVFELKKISRDFNTPVFALSSLNRMGYKDEVDMNSFKESGAIEYTSDVLLGMQMKGVGRKDFDVKQAKKANPREIELVIIKNRNGETADNIPYKYYKLFNAFQENIRR